MSASGPGHGLEDGPYRAVVRAVGASLQSLRWDGRDVVLPFADDEVRPSFRGAVLAPWPNRVGGGRWTWNGHEQQLPLTEPARATRSTAWWRGRSGRSRPPTPLR